MPVEVESRIPAIVTEADARAGASVAESTRAITARAKMHLIARGSVRSGGLLDSIEGNAEGLEGEVAAGDGLPDARAVYVELGTGVRGSEYEFPGKPGGIVYDMTWTRGIPKDPGHGFAYLIPALEEERAPLYAEAGNWYR